MSKSGDEVKRESWQKRLDRFEASNLSVAQFCRDEDVGVHTFYYWSKQLGRKSRQVGRSPDRSESRPKPCAAAASARNESQKTTREAVGTPAPVVHFTWNWRLSFSVPADCLDAIRCVLECASNDQMASRDARPVANAFRQVIAR